MPSSHHLLARLLELPQIEDQSDRRAIFRQFIAALGLGEASVSPMALAGVDPRKLAAGIQTATADGLLDDLDFIAPAAAALALYQIAGALPLGKERRSIGRQVLTHLYRGNAETFATLASRMALGSTRPLKGGAIRARAALAFELHGHADAAIDQLALAIVTRRELANDWVSNAATGSLPDRRLAGRLLQRATRQAARRAAAGDTHALRIFTRASLRAAPTGPPYFFDAIAAAWHTLLTDRETLVWRHVAIARGLLSAKVEPLAQEVQGHLSPNLTPTEWRRAATSLVARMAVEPDRALAEAMTLLEGPLLKRDPGIAMSMVWGLEPVAEVEPEAAAELLDAIASVSPISTAESVVALQRVVGSVEGRGPELCMQALRKSLSRPELDDGLSALARAILADLESGGRARALIDTIGVAVRAFGEHGSHEAHEVAQQALNMATERIEALESLGITYEPGIGTAEARQEAMGLLRELDLALLESRTLSYLLVLGQPPGSDTTAVTAIDDLDSRMATWLLDSKRRSATPEEVKTQTTLHQHQLRALLHLLDSSRTDFGDDHERRGRVRTRWTHACRVLVAHIHKQPKTRLTRAIIATIARAFDALVREGAADVVDVFLYATASFANPEHIGIVSEASMHPDVTNLLANYLRFIQTETKGSSAEQAKNRVEAFAHFLDTFPSQSTLRAEAFRTTAWALVHALRAVVHANSLTDLVPQNSTAVDASSLAAIEDAISQLHQLLRGAERRCSERPGKQQAVLPRQHALAHAVENAAHTKTDTGLLDALNQTSRAADASLPGPISQLITEALPRLATLPIEHAVKTDSRVESLVQLPPWLPSRRIIGGFYVLRQIGGGNVGTVFVVKRAEERHDPDAARFALKVPEYNATAARTMSEAEFLKLFREEAGALLSIPDHDNIASFVTFDAGAKPKPILVMELVDGVSCERILNSRSLDTATALKILEGVILGLEVMHNTGIAHLDVKPSNAILRDKDPSAVLVDFGLAGRKLRPGCATLCYGAPEIWQGEEFEDSNPVALAADVYAFGCFAYEVMTTRTLFDGNSDMAIIAAHIQHDGLPPPVAALAQHAHLEPFASFLHQCLRQDPMQRSSISQLRKELSALRPALENQQWPLGLPESA